MLNVSLFSIRSASIEACRWFVRSGHVHAKFVGDMSMANFYPIETRIQTKRWVDKSPIFFSNPQPPKNLFFFWNKRPKKQLSPIFPWQILHTYDPDRRTADNFNSLPSDQLWIRDLIEIFDWMCVIKLFTFFWKRNGEKLSEKIIEKTSKGQKTKKFGSPLVHSEPWKKLFGQNYWCEWDSSHFFFFIKGFASARRQ